MQAGGGGLEEYQKDIGGHRVGAVHASENHAHLIVCTQKR
jgi:hypothetical protein